MILFAVLPLIATVAPYILGGLDYLRRQLLPSAPATQPVSSAYTPPFTGGQCPTNYHVNINFRGLRYGSPFYFADQNQFNNIQGKISRLENTVVNGFVTVSTLKRIGVDGIEISAGSISPTSGDQWTEITISRIIRVDGQPDSCGNPANPNPSPSISNDGLATSAPPNPNNFLPLITGIAAATAAAFLAAKAAAAAALAAAKAAAIGGNVADAIAKLADALAEILKLLAALEKKKAKEKDEEKTVSKYDFGRVEKDGFLRLYPNENLAKQELSYLDVQVENIPTYTGKYFGQLSPHYYRYKSLGYISFVSPTFGILETRQIDFRRLSLNPPENAFGFFYHFGLDGIFKANLTGFYTKKEEEAESPAT